MLQERIRTGPILRRLLRDGRGWGRDRERECEGKEEKQGGEPGPRLRRKLREAPVASVMDEHL